MAKQAGLSEEVESQLFDMLQRKAINEINTLLDSQDLDEDIKTMLSGLSLLNGGKEVFVKARILMAGADDAGYAALDAHDQTGRSD